jgi:chromosome segregation ATPase
VEDDAVVSCNMAYNAMSLWNSILGDVLDYDGLQSSSMTLSNDDHHSITDKQGKLKENISIMIDRIQNKCERMKRIHSIFQSKSSRMFSTIETVIEKSNERASLAVSEVRNLTNELNMVQNTVERDRKQRQEEIEGMKEFREKILIENNNNIRLSESKLSTITNNYEREQSQNQTLSTTISNLHDELKSVQEINQELRIELENYFNIEETITEMKDRISIVTELNKDLQSGIYLLIIIFIKYNIKF